MGRDGIENRITMHPPCRTITNDASRAVGSLAVGAVAVGALALSAVAVGALAIGAIAIGRLAVGRARIRGLEIEELVVRRLRVTDELTVPPQSGDKTASARCGFTR